MKNEIDALSVRIRELEEKRAKELILLRAQFQTTQESLKPFNLIKSTISEAFSSSEIKKNISVIGIGTGLITKKLLVGSSLNPFKNLLGTLLQFAVGNVISKRAKGIKSKVGNFIHFYMKRRNESKQEFQDAQNMDELTELSNKNKVIEN